MRDSTLISSFYDGSCDKQIIIKDTGNQFTITDNKLITNSFTLSESLCSDVDLTLGACESSSVAFETTDTTSDLLGKTITVEIILNDDTTNPFKVGTYKIDSVSLSADKSKRSVVAYDALYDVINLDVAEWYESLTFDGMTLKTFRDTFFTHIGIQQDNVTLINDNIPVNKTITTSVMSGMDILSAICEINAVFGHINENNVFEYVSLGTTSVGTITTDKYMSATYEDYTVSTIDSVLIRTETDDVGVIYGATNPTNTLIIQGNFLVFGFNTTELREIGARIYNKCQNIPLFTPCEINTIGNLCYELGDLITVKDLSDGTFDTVILSRTFNGTKAFKDTFVTESNENREERVNGIESEYERLRGKYMLLNKSIDGINVTIGNDSSGLVHDIKVNATGLAQEISAREGLGQRVTTVESTADKIAIRMDAVERQIDGDYTSYTVTEEPDLNALGTNKPNKPSEDWCTNIPCNNTVQLGTNGVPFLYTEEDYKRNLRSMAFDMEECITYRFRATTNGNYEWERVADTEYGVILDKISTLQQTTDEISASVSEVATKADENAQLISETESSLTLRADNIESNVSQNYYTKTDVDSQWDRTSQSSKFTQTMNGFVTSVLDEKYVADNSDYQTLKTTVTNTAQSIVGVAYEKRGNTTSSFSYELNSSQFILRQSSSEVLVANKDGLSVKGKINVYSGTIGNGSSVFTISGNHISYGKSGLTDTAKGVYLGTNGISLGSNNVFFVNDDGFLSADNVSIKGNITAESGYIGTESQGFEISSDCIRNGKRYLGDSNNGVYVGTDGISLGTNNTFKVTSEGKLVAENADIKGKITATSGSFKGKVEADEGYFKGSVTASGGSIGDFTISGGNLYANGKTSLDENANGVFISKNGIALGYKNKFKVDNQGNLTATGVSISGAIASTSGNIGNWEIGTDSISRTVQYNGYDYNATIGTGSYGVANSAIAVRNRPTGTSSYTNVFRVTYGGKLIATDADIKGEITATSGTIGKCKINSEGYIEINGARITSGTIDSARIGTISADKITSGTLDADKVTIKNLKVSGNIDASQIVSGTISSDRISAETITGKFTSPSSGTMTLGTIRAQNFYYYTSKDGQAVSYNKMKAQKLTINGTAYFVMVI